MEFTLVGNYRGKFILDCLRSNFNSPSPPPQICLLLGRIMTLKSPLQGKEAIALFISLYLYLSRQVRDFRLFKSLIRAEECVQDLVSGAVIASL